MALTARQKASLYIRHHRQNLPALLDFALATNAEQLAIVDPWLATMKAQWQAQNAARRAEVDADDALVEEIP